jgi:hypothetical protein
MLRTIVQLLNLPFHCELTYECRLQATDLVPIISFWHEYLDLTFFFKTVNWLVCVNEEITPEGKHGNTRTTRATSNSDIITFRIRKCKTVTFQGWFTNRTARVWNILPAELRHQSLTLPRFKSLLLDYPKTVLYLNYQPQNPRTWKSICLKCKTARSLAAPLSCCY